MYPHHIYPPLIHLLHLHQNQIVDHLVLGTSLQLHPVKVEVEVLVERILQIKGKMMSGQVEVVDLVQDSQMVE